MTVPPLEGEATTAPPSGAHPEETDYLRDPETPAEWRAEIESYLDFDEHDLKRDLPIIRQRIGQLIEACPHEDVKA
ncbi:MAG: hypothetical protein KY449_13765 [Proteobacteria bacterium]|nr:hypothetical protein [Pseudomonadota bacterium]